MVLNMRALPLEEMLVKEREMCGGGEVHIVTLCVTHPASLQCSS